jgi:hypothetical protein
MFFRSTQLKEARETKQVRMREDRTQPGPGQKPSRQTSEHSGETARKVEKKELTVRKIKILAITAADWFRKAKS